MNDSAARLAARWGYTAPVARTPLVLAVTVLLVGGLALFFVAGVASILAGVMVLLAWLAGAAWWVSSRGRAALRSARPVQVQAPEMARLSTLARAVAAEAGVPPARLLVVSGSQPNALIAPGISAAVALTEGAIAVLGRTELEALLAHSLVRVTGRRGLIAALTVALGPLAPREPDSVSVCDLAAVAVTRYPPALASALEKGDDRDGRFAPFWFRGSSRVHGDVAARVAALREL